MDANIESDTLLFHIWMLVCARVAECMIRRGNAHGAIDQADQVLAGVFPGEPDPVVNRIVFLLFASKSLGFLRLGSTMSARVEAHNAWTVDPARALPLIAHVEHTIAFHGFAVEDSTSQDSSYSNAERHAAVGHKRARSTWETIDGEVDSHVDSHVARQRVY